MSDRQWTTEQQEVIDSRGCNLLVSAAAGSGKTAVLVERIIQLVTDPVHPLDIDRLLVVTFTRAAAGEMKERIGAALQKALEENPGNLHLQRQGVLLHHAQISTIHGFCTYVIQNYFTRIGIDPGYRIADEGELKLMRADVIEALLERKYEEGRPEFLAFMDSYAPGKSDTAIENVLLKLYEFASATPYPEEWLDNCLKIYQTADAAEPENSFWMKETLEETRSRLTGIREYYRELRDRAAGPDGVANAVPILENDMEILEALSRLNSYREFRERLQKPGFKIFRVKLLEGERTEVKDQISKQRQDLGKKVKAIYSSCFSRGPEELQEEFEQLCGPMQVLIGLEKDFIHDFAQAKRAKNVADFSDLEHFALDILVEREEDGSLHRTDAALELAGRFREVMIDEYQDSNRLQESLIAAVSGNESGIFNRFMVGDIKQSIYRFRMADPSIFRQKYLEYQKANVRRKDADQPGVRTSDTGNAGDGTSEDSCAGDRTPEDSYAGDRTPDIVTDGECRQSENGYENGTALQRIDLNCNFRSRREVLESVNAVFERIMIPELGGIPYDEDASLKYGSKTYVTNENAEAFQTELLVVDSQSLEEEDLNLDGAYGNLELEALAVANKIKDVMARGTVQDTDADGSACFRRARYRDIVILLRSAGVVADTFVQVLKQEGIPAYATSKAGYFSAVEVTTVMNYLRILDNPQQDIPFTAVLRSPIVGCSDEELAEIRVFGPKLSMPDAAEHYMQRHENSLTEKLSVFFRQLNDFRNRIPYTEVHELIREILEETGYGIYAAAMPAGQQREANLRMLMEKAVDYENTSYHGLFQFVRYIEKLEKYQVDDGEVSIFGEAEDTVRVMTIHASKGLEFPIVFVSTLGRQLNLADVKDKFTFHAEMGIGANLVHLDDHTRRESYYQGVVKRRIKRDSLGEEMRILYVAMTRAKEKLILTGYLNSKSAAKGSRAAALQAVNDRRIRDGEQRIKAPIDYEHLMSASSYLDWILLAMPESRVIRMHFIGQEDLVETAVGEIGKTKEALVHIQKKLEDPSGIHAEGVCGLLTELDRFRYPYLDAAALPAKLTVSDIKKAAMEEMEEEKGLEPFQTAESAEAVVPEFIRNSESGMQSANASGGAARGTIYHHFLQCFDYGKLNGKMNGTKNGNDSPEKSDSKEFSPEEQTSKEQNNILPIVEGEILRMKDCGLLSDADAAVLQPEDLRKFLMSGLGQRMRMAYFNGTLRREQPFVLEVKAKDIDSSWPEEENILVQGTIDAYFTEKDRYVLVDYKTDRVFTADGSDLVDKYRKQLEYYAMALERITGIEVAEMWIYSVTLGKEIRLG